MKKKWDFLFHNIIIVVKQITNYLIGKLIQKKSINNKNKQCL